MFDIPKIIEAVGEEKIHEVLFDSKDELINPMRLSTNGKDPFKEYWDYHIENGGNSRFIANYDILGNRIWK